MWGSRVAVAAMLRPYHRWCSSMRTRQLSLVFIRVGAEYFSARVRMAMWGNAICGAGALRSQQCCAPTIVDIHQCCVPTSLVFIWVGAEYFSARVRMVQMRSNAICGARALRSQQCCAPTIVDIHQCCVPTSLSFIWVGNGYYPFRVRMAMRGIAMWGSRVADAAMLRPYHR